MDSNTNTPKSTKKAQPESNKKRIKLVYNKNNLFVPADQLTKVPKKEDDNYLAGDLVWVKSKGFPYWPCMLTVDPETGKYSKAVVVRDNNEKVFHVQYFGTKPYRGYTQGNVFKYEGKEKYELKLDQIKNTPTPNKSQRKQELSNLSIKPSFKREWIVACSEADEAMKLERSARIEKLTFEYILDKPKSVIKKEQKVSEEKSTPSTSKSASKSATKSANKSSAKKRKIEDEVAETPTTSKSQSKSKRKKKTNANDSSKSSPGDVYDFNLFEEEFEEETPKKLFELSSARRAKGEYDIYAKQMRANIQKENPELDADEIEKKLKHNWNLMSEDMRNSYGPRPTPSNLSFHLETPEKNSNSSVLDSASKQQGKTYSGLKRGRRSAKTENDFEKENAVDDESDDEEQAPAKDNEDVAVGRRGSSRKKLFKQDYDANNETKVKTATETPKRQSARMKTGKPTSLKEQSIGNKPASATPKAIAKNQTPKRKTSETNSIKKVASSKQSTEETNGNNLDKDNQDEDSASCSSESEKTEQKEEVDAEEKDKERFCGKCKMTGKSLVRCEGDCLTWYHKECLYKGEESAAEPATVEASS